MTTMKTSSYGRPNQTNKTPPKTSMSQLSSAHEFVDSGCDNNDDDYGDVNGDGCNDDGVEERDGFSSWDEESDEELTASPPVNLDVSKVVLIGACPYCHLSFVGDNGKILHSVLKRMTPGNEAEFAEEHIDRCCLRQYKGELIKCAECDKQYLKHPRKEQNHWRKYHPNRKNVVLHAAPTCPFEQCSETLLQSDAALRKHLSSAHYWSKT